MMCAFLLQSTLNFAMYKTLEINIKVLKKDASRVGKKYPNKTTNIRHPNIKHSALLQPYFTLSTILLS